MANEYDVVVIGAGTGGYPAAIRAAQLGLRVAVVERQKALGGTCLIWGCIPTKALIEHAHALKIARAAKEWGLTLDGAAVGIDMARVQARKDRIVTGLTKGVEFLFRKNKIDWIKGTARLAGNGNVEVTGEQPQVLHAAKEIVVATGSQPRSVRGVEIDRKRIITSDEAIGLNEVPKSIAILGAGAIGVEFGCLLRRFGSEVTIVEILPRVVPLEDEAVSAELQKALKKQGIRALTGTKLTRATALADGVDIAAERPDGQAESIRVDYLLVATGRGPVTEGLGAVEAGLQLENGYIRVDEFFRTGVPGISAIGDVITLGVPGHPQLAHVSTAEGVAVAERIAGLEPRADQLRPRAVVHVLRSGDRQRWPDRAGSQGPGVRRAGGFVPLLGRSGGRRSRPRSKGSSRSSPRRSTTRCSVSTSSGPARQSSSPRRRWRSGSSAPSRSWSARSTPIRRCRRRWGRRRTRSHGAAIHI